MTRNIEKYEKSIDYLTILLLAFITFSIAIAQSAFFLAALLSLVTFRKELKKKLSGINFTLPALLFFLAAVISLIFHADGVNALKCAKKLKIFLIFAAYYFFLLNRPTLAKIKKYNRSLLIGFSLALLYILAQFFLGKELLPFRHETFIWNDGHRIYPLYGQFAAVILMVSLPLIIFSNKISKKERIALVVMLVPIFLTLYFARSRTSFISVFISTLLMFSFKFKKTYLLIIVAVIVAGFGFFALRGESNILKNYLNPSDTTTRRYVSNQLRINMLNDVKEIFSEHPLTGIGFYGYKYYTAKKEYHHDKIFNDYLNVLATMGLVGLAPFLWLLFTLFRESLGALRLLRIIPSEQDYFINLSFGIFLGFICFLLNAMFEPIFFNTKALMLMLLLLSLNRVIIEEVGIEPKE